ncbi:MAG TPA: glutaredoxin family protein [Rubrivivax sp.]|nr:glutaredoxin family protein [Rubrivivax sp.]
MSRNPFAITPDAVRAAALAVALACLALPASALYKVVGPDGRITYTDRPPSDTGSRVTPINRDSQAEAAPQDTLPQELRQATTRYPVTLYVTADCAPCDAARQLLVQRGVPFTEKRVVSDDDAAALERVIGGRTVPSLTIGSQALRGLSQTDWNAYLDAAGYPRESRLPRGWVAPAATPLVERSPARAAAAAASAPAAAAPPAEQAPKPTTGLRF